ncbi:cobalt transporter [Shewanella litoralis]|uniref:Cobalt transporter n=1 Tax=Shewanella litoralis TaxID=2282700 RepID=A0ABQ2RJ42_9GAMM|nr:cobalt transporter [Shewanella litoralis]
MSDNSHQHPASHGHSHIPKDMSSSRIGWAFILNVCFTIIEFIGGWLTNSTAIMADAVHDLGDSLSIGLAWGLNKLSKKSRDETFSYGYHRFSLLGALINGVVLIAGSIWVLTISFPRLISPEMPDAQGMLWLAILGVIVNGYAAFKLSEGKTLNERVLNWHLLEDVLGWVAVLIVAIVLIYIELPILDPILSIGFTLFVLFNVLKNLRTAIRLFLQATPEKAIQEKIKIELSTLKFIEDIHHFHLWSLDGERHVLTAHLVVNHYFDQQEYMAIKHEISTRLSPFYLEHTTLEFEFVDEICRDAWLDSPSVGNEIITYCEETPLSSENEYRAALILSILENDMQQHPEKLQPLTASMRRSAESLVESVEIDFGAQLLKEDE